MATAQLSRSPDLQNQSFIIDFLKTFAVQIIILHHLCNYGEIPLKVGEIWPFFVEFLGAYGKYAVQIFLVIGGYLAAKHLPQALSRYGLCQTIIDKYWRLAPAYSVAICITMGCAMLARTLHNEEYLGSPETFLQILSHLFFLQNILGYESISVGVWYIAIDWQLYTVIACALFLLKSMKNVLWLLAIMMLVAQMHWSHRPFLDNYFIYFIGAYGLGILVFLAHDVRCLVTQNLAKRLLFTFFIVFLFGLMIDFRIKNIVEMACAGILFIYAKKAHHTTHLTWSKICLWFSQRSYSAFLIHFSLIILGNTLFHFLALQNPMWAILFMVHIWILSWLFAHLLFTYIELPLRKILGRRRSITPAEVP